ncbi:glycosyltransferase [Candidatus Methylopumilus universalis]|uniref:glycosyltransferase n=1 Tax=Candidatus Methylopumilus universalis TaxID=2588536 RepID=UPI003BEEE024
MKRTPSSVAILLCSYQGESYIEDQLLSFIEQTYPHWRLFISDDGSRDRTLKIIQQFKLHHQIKLHLFKGPKHGFAQNFIGLTKRPQVKSTYYAWADQDDIWRKRKLEKAIWWLDRQPASLPLLFCSRTLLVDDLNRYIQLTFPFKKPKTFQNALVQNIAGGNTMVFNEKARQLFLEAAQHKNISAHDWLIYQVVTACGGIVHFDEKPSLRYRQHTKNMVGMNGGVKARVNRVKLMLQGQYQTWNYNNTKALGLIYSHMTAQNRVTLDTFKAAGSASLVKRLLFLKQSGVYRQTFLENIGLILSALLNKI